MASPIEIVATLTVRPGQLPSVEAACAAASSAPAAPPGTSNEWALNRALQSLTIRVTASDEVSLQTLLKQIGPRFDALTGATVLGRIDCVGAPPLLVRALRSLGAPVQSS